jgi:hypothetical protein
VGANQQLSELVRFLDWLGTRVTPGDFLSTVFQQ